jgi:hypothetical protein
MIIKGQPERGHSMAYYSVYIPDNRWNDSLRNGVEPLRRAYI